MLIYSSRCGSADFHNGSQVHCCTKSPLKFLCPIGTISQCRCGRGTHARHKSTFFLQLCFWPKTNIPLPSAFPSPKKIHMLKDNNLVWLERTESQARDCSLHDSFIKKPSVSHLKAKNKTFFIWLPSNLTSENVAGALILEQKPSIHRLSKSFMVFVVVFSHRAPIKANSYTHKHKMLKTKLSRRSLKDCSAVVQMCGDETTQNTDTSSHFAPVRFRGWEVHADLGGILQIRNSDQLNQEWKEQSKYSPKTAVGSEKHGKRMKVERSGDDRK